MVECKNCKHYSALTHTERSIDYVRVTKYCDPENTMKTIGMTITYDKGDLKQCEIQNRDNNCEYYKRKWWKFWIKEIYNSQKKPKGC